MKLGEIMDRVWDAVGKAESKTHEAKRQRLSSLRDLPSRRSRKVEEKVALERTMPVKYSAADIKELSEVYGMTYVGFRPDFGHESFTISVFKNTLPDVFDKAKAKDPSLTHSKFSDYLCKDKMSMRKSALLGDREILLLNK